MDHSIINIENGKYAISLQALKKGEDEPSVMADYLSQRAILSKQDETYTLSLLFQSEQIITGFQIESSEGQFVDAVERQVDEEMERRYEMFQVHAVPTTLNARVQYEVDHEGSKFKGNELFKIVFAEETLEKLV